GRALLLPLTMTFAGCAACVLLNPWGWRLPHHLLTFFAARGPALRATSEFAPAAIDDRAGMALLVYASLCAVGLGCGLWGAAHQRHHRPAAGTGDGTWGAFGPFHPGTILSLLLTMAMAVSSIRHVEVMVIFGALVISGGLSLAFRQWADPEAGAYLAALREREVASKGCWAAPALVVVWVLAFTGLLPRAGFNPAKFPVSAVAALKAAEPAPAGPVFAPDVWGGYLILEWPQARVFVDGRWDMYGDRFFTRYADIYLAQ